MPPEFKAVFERLRGLLQKHTQGLTVSEDTTTRYCLSGPVGPATLQAWGGKMKSPVIAVAFVQIGKAYVSYHLIAVYGPSKLRDSMSPALAKRMQGKTCFNFTTVDETLFAELDDLTGRGCAAMKRAGFIQ
jgi:hypothetical protein